MGDDYVLVGKDFPMPDGVRAAAFVFIYARTTEKLWDQWPQKALVSMHLRFDGKIGFPGGMIEPGENMEVGVNRELKEELGSELQLKDTDWMFAHYSKNHSIVCHFYTKEVSVESFVAIEKTGLSAKEFGIEVLGSVRVPLYQRKRNGGLPQFLKNNFAGNAREQLLKCLVMKNILTEEEVAEAVKYADS